MIRSCAALLLALGILGSSSALAQYTTTSATAATSTTDMSKAKPLTTTTTYGAGGTYLSPNMIPNVGGAAGAQNGTANMGDTTMGSFFAARFGGNRALANINAKAAAGRSGTSGASGTSGGPVSPLQGSEWLLQRNHARGSFVGPDSTDNVGFIGEDQATTSGPIQSAISSLSIHPLQALMNPPLKTRQPNAIYDPRLCCGFQHASRPVAAVNVALSRHLEEMRSLRSLGPIAVSVEETTATLRGEVASEPDRLLAEQLVLFEPGVDQVRNLLSVKAPANSPAQ